VKRVIFTALATALTVAGAVLVLSADMTSARVVAGPPVASAATGSPGPVSTPTAAPNGVRWGSVAHVVATVTPSPAPRRHRAAFKRSARPVVAPYLTAYECGGIGVLDVHWASVELVPGTHTWRARMDHGRAVLWAHATGPRYGPDGVWKRVATTGAEHFLRWPGYGQPVTHGGVYDALRVEEDGYLSEAAAVYEECVA
jgi:hypothetical protein